MKRGPTTDLDRALADLRGNQQARRSSANHRIIECDEIRALKRLAHDTFGDRGVVEFATDPLSGARTGVLLLGYFTEPPPPPGKPKNPHRRRNLVFQGATYAELAAQVARWRELGGDR